MSPSLNAAIIAMTRNESDITNLILCEGVLRVASSDAVLQHPTREWQSVLRVRTEAPFHRHRPCIARLPRGCFLAPATLLHEETALRRKILQPSPNHE